MHDESARSSVDVLLPRPLPGTGAVCWRGHDYAVSLNYWVAGRDPCCGLDTPRLSGEGHRKMDRSTRIDPVDIEVPNGFERASIAAAAR